MQNIIFYYRKKVLKINQKEFAKIIRENIPGNLTDKNTVSRWELGEHYPNLSVIRYLARAMTKSEREIINNLTRHLRPSKYTLEGDLKTTLNQKPKQESFLINLAIEEGQQKIN